jgi:hypothetical protein
MKRCPTCGRRELRSSEANRRYWSLVHAIAERPVKGVHYSADTWHIWLKQRFLGSKDIELPSGKTVTIPMSTASLDTSEFSDYMTKVEVWANEHDIYLSE